MHVIEYIPFLWDVVSVTVTSSYFNVTYLGYSIKIADTVTNGTQKIEWEAPEFHSPDDKIAMYHYDNILFTYTLVDAVRVESPRFTFGVVKLTTKHLGKHISTYERNNAVTTSKQFIVK